MRLLRVGVTGFRNLASAVVDVDAPIVAFCGPNGQGKTNWLEAVGVLGTLRPEDRVAAVRELLRILRPGGRVLIMGASPRGGLGAILTRATSGPPFACSGEANLALQADGFASVRTLADRQGLVFVEGLKARTARQS